MSDETTTTPAAPAEAAPAAAAPPTLPPGETAPATSPSGAEGASIPRPVDVIRIEYTNLCARLGQLVYNMGQAEKEKEDLLNEIFARVREERNLPQSMKDVPVPPLAPQPPAQA
jgi:hypothetical protein